MTALSRVQKNKTPDFDQQLRPVVGFITVGNLFSRSFRVGTAVGALLLIPHMLLVLFLLNIGKAEHGLKKKKVQKKESPYRQAIRSMPLYKTCIVIPAKEEIMRGTIQAGIIAVANSVLPILCQQALCAPQIACIEAVGILVSATLFGAAHLRNKHEGAKIQSIGVGISAIPVGMLQLRYGLISAIASHIIHNTLVFIRSNDIEKRLTQQRKKKPTTATARP